MWFLWNRYRIMFACAFFLLISPKIILTRFFDKDFTRPPETDSQIRLICGEKLLNGVLFGKTRHAAGADRF